MGYRSDVVLALSKEAAQKLRDAAVDNQIGEDTRKEMLRLLEEADSHCVDPKSGAEIWEWGLTKWYMEYAGIRCLMGTLSDLTQDDYRFVRIGEEYDDIEVLGGLRDFSCTSLDLI